MISDQCYKNNVISNVQVQNVVIVKMDYIIADIKAECMTDLCTYILYLKFKNMDIVPKYICWQVGRKY